LLPLTNVGEDRALVLRFKPRAGVVAASVIGFALENNGPPRCETYTKSPMSHTLGGFMFFGPGGARALSASRHQRSKKARRRLRALVVDELLAPGWC